MMSFQPGPDLPFFSLANLKCVLWSFCRGLTDSLKFRDVFILDDKTEKDRADKLMQNNFKKEFLLNRESPSRELENLAKRRAVERREQLERTNGGSVNGDSPNNKNSEPKILERTLKCCLLNGCVFWFSIILFEYVLIPLVQVWNNFNSTFYTCKLCICHQVYCTQNLQCRTLHR
jgi:hypothetical protein